MLESRPDTRRVSACCDDATYAWLLAAGRDWLAARAPEGAARLGVLQAPPPDWAALERAAHVHGLEPILHTLVRESGELAAQVPDHLKAKWERAYYGTRVKNSETLTVLARILETCEQARAPVLVLKGPAAMAAVYHDVGLRPMADLDLLCRVEDLPVVAAAARAAGFNRTGAPYLHQLDFYSEREDTLLELHFDAYFCMRHRRQFLDTAWRASERATVEEWTFPVMSLEHQVVFDTAHCMHDGFEMALKHALDFAGRLIPGQNAVPAGVLRALLDETGLAETFSLLVRALQRLFALALDPAAASPVSDDRAAAFRDCLVTRSRSIGVERAPRAAAEFLRQRGIGRRASLVRRRLFPPLAALQAAHGLRSRLRSLPYVPAYAGNALLDTAIRLRKGV